jgi:hypothetical protein
MHFRIKGKRDKIRFIPIHAMALRLIGEYLEALAKHGGGQLERNPDAPLFRPVKNNRTGTLDKHLDPGSTYRNIVSKHGRETGIDVEVNGLCVHSMRATAATNALSNEADIAKAQEWLGRANVSTARLYDRRKSWGDEGYSREELVAELGSAFLCADLELQQEPREENAAYIATWLEVLKNDNRAIFAAAAHAQRAADYLNQKAAAQFPETCAA